MYYVLISGNHYSIIDFTNGAWARSLEVTTWFVFNPTTVLSDVVYTPDQRDAHYMLDFASIEDWIASLNSDEDCIHITGYLPTVFTEPYQLSIIHPELFV